MWAAFVKMVSEDWGMSLQRQLIVGHSHVSILILIRLFLTLRSPIIMLDTFLL